MINDLIDDYTLGKLDFMDELIKRCIENNGYVGLIVVKNKINKEFYDEFNKLKCKINKNRIQFDNGSYIFVLNESQLEANRYNYAVIDSNVEKVYKDNFIYPKLVPYRDNDMKVLLKFLILIRIKIDIKQLREL